MIETLSFGAMFGGAGIALVVHKKGLVYSLRVVANWWWAVAYGVAQFQREFALLNEETRHM